MSSVYLDADRHALEVGARLADRFADGDTSVLAELRHLRAELGLSPLARQRLLWQVDQPAAAVAVSPREQRRRLRAVP